MLLFCSGIHHTCTILMPWKYKWGIAEEKPTGGKYVNACDVGSWEK